MLEIYALQQNEILNDKSFNSLLPYVSTEKKARINRYIQRPAAQQALMSDLLVRSIIHEKLSIKNSDIRFGQNEYGKPYLLGNDNFHFNLSHSGDWVVCAISDSVVGIDVEKIKPTDYNISKRFFSKDENDYLICQKERQKLDTFYDLWTLKESYIKAVGKGLHMSLRDFSIIIYNGFIFLKHQIENHLFNFKQFSIDIRYKLSVCLGSEFRDEELSVIYMQDFLNSIESKSRNGFTHAYN
ncbi:MAG: 4'-phosphopantetheinyl transferase superfamily protein [Proteobacteria bacterium]|nr:4'-phosphopantetheinyl transferase superfamily protein [Pseudomonadota bacterium]